MPRTVRLITFTRSSEEAEGAITRILKHYNFFAFQYNGETVWKRYNYGHGVPAAQYLKLACTSVGVRLEAWIGTDGGTEEIPLTGFSEGSAKIVLRIIVEEIQAQV